MSDNGYANFETGKSDTDRTVMHVLYGMHTVSPFTAWVLAVIALIVNYIRKGDENDALYISHHAYMIRTFWWTLLWLVVTSPLYLLLFLPGAIAWFIVGAWYVYRCIRGWLRFNDNQPAP